MDSTNLSSNWKKLQQTLKSQSPASIDPKQPKEQNGQTKPLKRKAESTASNAANIGVKRPRKEPRIPLQTPAAKKQVPRPARTKMGGYLSTPAPDKPESASTEAGDKKDEILRAPSSKRSTALAGKFIAIDCEMVGTTSTTIFSVKSHNNNDFSILARVSIVSYAQEILYDTYVLPPSGVQVTDYRTKYSGITAWHLNPENTTTSPRTFEKVQEDVAQLFEGRILVGHAINNDLAVLGLSHPKRSIRDTSSYPKYRELAAATKRDGTPGKARKPALKMLATNVLGYDIQNDDTRGHDSVEDAKATMALFQREKKGFEDEAVKKFGRGALSAAVTTKKSTIPRVESPGLGEEDLENSDEEVDSSDDEADEAELENIENIDTDKKPTKVAKKKKKKKKKGKYRR